MACVDEHDAKVEAEVAENKERRMRRDAKPEEAERLARQEVLSSHVDTKAVDAPIAEALAAARASGVEPTEKESAALLALHKRLLKRLLQRLSLREAEKASVESEELRAAVWDECKHLRAAHPSTKLPLLTVIDRCVDLARPTTRTLRAIARLAHAFPGEAAGWQALAAAIPVLALNKANDRKRARFQSAEAKSVGAAAEPPSFVPEDLDPTSSSAALSAVATVSTSSILALHPLNEGKDAAAGAAELAGFAALATAAAEAGDSKRAAGLVSKGLRLWKREPRPLRDGVKARLEVALAQVYTDAGPQKRQKAKTLFGRVTMKTAPEDLDLAARQGLVRCHTLDGETALAEKAARDAAQTYPWADWPLAAQAHTLLEAAEKEEREREEMKAKGLGEGKELKTAGGGSDDAKALAARAKDLALQALGRDPSNPDNHLCLGSAYRLLGGSFWSDKAFAFDALLRAAKLDPSQPAPFALLGRWYASAQAPPDTTRASRCFRKALSLDPGHADAGQALASIYRATGQRVLLREVLRSATEANPGARWAWMQRARAAVARAAGCSGSEGEADVREAVLSLQSALRCDPKDPQVWEELGEAYHRQGKYAAALKSINRALELEPLKTPSSSPPSQRPEHLLAWSLRSLQLAETQLSMGQTNDATRRLQFVWDLLTNNQGGTASGGAEANVGVKEWIPPAWLRRGAARLLASALCARARDLRAEGATLAAKANLDEAWAALALAKASADEEEEERSAAAGRLKAMADVRMLQADLCFLTNHAQQPPPPEAPEDCVAWASSGRLEALKLLGEAGLCIEEALGKQGSGVGNTAASEGAREETSGKAGLWYDRAVLCVLSWVCVGGLDEKRKEEAKPNSSELQRMAIESLANALRISPKYPQAWRLLAVACSLGDLDEQKIAAARQHCLTKALAADPRGQGAAAAWADLGLLYLRKRMPARARKVLVRAQSLDPDLEEHWANAGLAALAMLPPDLAPRQLFEALALARAAFRQANEAAETEGRLPSLPALRCDAIASFCMHHLRAARLSAGEPHRGGKGEPTPELVTALRAAARLVEMAPGDAAAHNLMGCLNELSGDLCGSAESLEAAWRLLHVGDGGGGVSTTTTTPVPTPADARMPMVLCNLARVTARRKEGKRAREKKKNEEALQGVVAWIEEAKRAAGVAAASAPDLSALVLECEGLVRLGHHDHAGAAKAARAAVAACTAASSSAPSSSSHPALGRANLLLSLALHSQGEHKGALAFAEAAVAAERRRADDATRVGKADEIVTSLALIAALRHVFALRLATMLRCKGSEAASATASAHAAAAAVREQEGPPFVVSMECETQLALAQGNQSKARRLLCKLVHARPVRASSWNALARLVLPSPGGARLAQVLTAPLERGNDDSAGGGAEADDDVDAATTLTTPLHGDAARLTRRRMQARARVERGEPSALAAACRSIRDDPTRGNVWVVATHGLALAALRDGRPERLRSAAQFILQDSLPFELGARTQLSVVAYRCLLLAGDAEKAREGRKRMRNEGGATGAGEVGVAVRAMLCVDEARALLLECVEGEEAERKAWEEALGWYKKGLELAADNVLIWEELGAVYAAQGAVAAAERCLTAGLDRLRRQKETNSEAQARVLLRLASLAFFTKRYVAGTKWAAEASAQTPHSPAAHFLHGLFLRKARRFDEALEAFATAFKLRKLGRSSGGAYQDDQRLDNDDLALASLNLFAVYLKRKEFRKCVEALQREKTLNPTLGAIAYQMGIVAQKARKASKKEGAESEAAHVAEELGDPSRWFDEAIKLNPAAQCFKKALEKETKT